MPILSIITINFNNNDGLEKTINSVINQSFIEYELIIIDGGSSDGSSKLLTKYSDKIAYAISEPDDGIYYAQNKGIAVAKGEYCLFLNSGDYLKENDVLQKVFCVTRSEELLACNMEFDYDRKLISKEQPVNLNFFYMMDTSLFHPATFIKRNLFEKYGLYNTDYTIAADYDFFLKCTMVQNVTYKQMPIILSVFDTNGISSNIAHIEKHKHERLKIQKSYFSDQIVYAALEHNELLNSNSFKLLNILKGNRLLYKASKFVINNLIKIKRKVN
jgi:glycosyltransferase involved in cell wall biosynthesis